jgi:murein tripeptide amidase MpaA
MKDRMLMKNTRAAGFCSVLLMACVAGGLAGSATAQPTPLPPPALPPERFDGHAVVRATIRTAEELDTLRRLSADSWSCTTPGLGVSDWRIAPDRLAELQASGIEFVTLIPDVQRLIDQESARIRAGLLDGPGQEADAWFNDYKDLAAINAKIDAFIAQYPAMASRGVVGTSIENRQIPFLRIASPGSPANKPALLIKSLQHAREWIGGATTMYVASKLLTGFGTDPQITRVLNNFQVIIVPVANPDGYVYTWTTNRLWRKNRRPNIGTSAPSSFGVDLNRNWAYQWGGQGASTAPNNDTYRGTAGFSEPETLALSGFITARPYVKLHIDVHSYSQLILSPWSYTATLPPDNDVFTTLNAVFKAGMEGVNGLTYTAGPTYTTIYPASGASGDWTYGARGIFGWGVELRDTGTTGFILPPAQIVPQGEEFTKGLLDLADAIDQPVRITFPNGLPGVVSAAAPTSVTVRLQRINGALDGASARLNYRVGRFGDFTSVPLTPAGGDYTATLPAVICGAALQWTVTAANTAGAQSVEPGPGEAQSVFTTPAGTVSPASVCTPCLTDFNLDGYLNLDDLGDFITEYYRYIGQASFPAYLDYQPDGILNLDDLGDFITDYYAGRCA